MIGRALYCGFVSFHCPYMSFVTLYNLVPLTVSGVERENCMLKVVTNRLSLFPSLIDHYLAEYSVSENQYVTCFVQIFSCFRQKCKSCYSILISIGTVSLWFVTALL